MSPTTRAAGRPKASPSNFILDRQNSTRAINGSPNTQLEQEEPNYSSREPRITLEGLLKGALKEAKYLERENTTLRKKVATLEDKLGRLQDSDNAPLRPKRTLKTSASVAGLQGEVQKLKSQVRQLQKSKEKYRKRLHDLSLREIKTEASELVEDAEFEVGDSAYQMRKLLRDFHDLMVVNSLEGGSEECPICMEPLKHKECHSLPCQHMLCNDCLSKLRPVAEGDRDIESIRCPQCRELCQRDEPELVEYTASEQWDALLDVAKRWARMDTRREADTSEEEDEEEFIDDGENETSTTVSEHLPTAVNPLETSPEPEPEEAEDGPPKAEPPITPSRLRRRTVVETPPTSSEPEPQGQAVSNTVPEREGEEQDPQPEQPSTPPPEAGPSTQTYAQTPRKDKRKMLEEMAAARSKKRRL